MATEPSQIEIRAIFAKGSQFSILALSAQYGARVGYRDAALKHSVATVHGSVACGLRAFNKCRETIIASGWTQVYEGQPFDGNEKRKA